VDQQPSPGNSRVQQSTLQAILRIKPTKTVPPFFGWSEEEAREEEEWGMGGGGGGGGEKKTLFFGFDIISTV